MTGERITTAAGGIVWRRRTAAVTSESATGKPPVELLLIHRPRYDDWSFPKGKSDAGETLQQTAVREIAEETGVQARLVHPLPRVDYRVASGLKHVSYWVARATEAEPFTPNDEVDEVRWVRAGEADDLLSYDHDRDLLDDFRRLQQRKLHRTRTLVVLRHAKAVSRDVFDGDDDAERPLAEAGLGRADDLVPVLEAYGARHLVSSPAVRCAATLEPYADHTGTFLQLDDRLGEDTDPRQVERSVRALLDHKKPAVLCSHRPTLPWIFAALGLDPVDLSPGQGVVVHHRKGHVRATERI